MSEAVWLWQQSLRTYERLWALAVVRARLVGGRIGFCAQFWESPAEAYLCTGLYALSIVPFTLADLSTVLGDV